MGSPPKQSSGRGWMIWLIVAIFYLYELILRIVPSVILSDLMHDLHITATGIGTLSAFYYYAYTPMQLPVGILIDRFGARFQLALACFLCVAGSYLFSTAYRDPAIAFSRLLIGFGSSYAWVGFVYLVSHWFPSRKMGLLVGLGSSIGLLGGIFGQGPMVTIVKAIGWRGTNFQLGLIGLAITLALWTIVRDLPKNKKTAPSKGTLRAALTGFKTVVTSPQSWICALFSLALYLSISVFAELWGISFLQHVYGLSALEAGWGTSLIYCGMLVGGPVFGLLSDYTCSRKRFTIAGAAMAALCMAVIVLAPHLSVTALYATLFLFGFATGVQLLAFSIAIELNLPSAKGSALAFNNFITMVGGMIMQPLVGWFLDWGWSGATTGGIRSYSAQDFRWALLALPISCLIGCVLACCLRETHCKNVDGSEHHFEPHAD